MFTLLLRRPLDVGNVKSEVYDTQLCHQMYQAMLLPRFSPTVIHIFSCRKLFVCISNKNFLHELQIIEYAERVNRRYLPRLKFVTLARLTLGPAHVWTHMYLPLAGKQLYTYPREYSSSSARAANFTLIWHDRLLSAWIRLNNIVWSSNIASVGKLEKLKGVRVRKCRKKKIEFGEGSCRVVQWRWAWTMPGSNVFNRWFSILTRVDFTMIIQEIYKVMKIWQKIICSIVSKFETAILEFHQISRRTSMGNIKYRGTVFGTPAALLCFEKSYVKNPVKSYLFRTRF